MKKFRIKALEQEMWERFYFVEAETQKEAEEKVKNGEVDSYDGETYHIDTPLIDDIEEVEE